MGMTKIPAKLASLGLRFPKTVLLIGFIITSIAGFYASKLVIKNDFIDMLPQKMKQVILAKNVVRKMDGVGFQTVIATSPDKHKNRKFLSDLKKHLELSFWKPPRTSSFVMQKEYEKLGRLFRDILSAGKYMTKTRKAELSLITKRFHEDKLIEYAYHKNKQDFFESRALLFLTASELKTLYSRLKKKVKYEVTKNTTGFLDDDEKDPGLKTKDIEKKYRDEVKKVPKRLEVKDGDVYHSALAVRPFGSSSDFDFSMYFVKQLKDAVKKLKPSSYHAKMDVRFSGPYTQNLREYGAASSELKQSFLGTFLLLLFLLLFFFRKPRVILFIMLPLSMGTAWAFGMTFVVIGSLNVITGLSGALLLGLGVDYGIYLIDRYWVERRKGKDLKEAVEATFGNTGEAVLTAGMTTAAGFFALLLCGFKGFSEFGFISGAGIVFCLLAICSILPALLALMENKEDVAPPAPLWEPKKMSRTRFPMPWVFVLASIGILFAVPYFIRKVPIQFNMKKLTFQDGYFKVNERRFKKLQDKFIQSINPIFYIVKTRKEAKVLQDQLDALSKNDKPLKDILRKLGKFEKKEEKAPKAIENIYSIFRFVPENQQKKMVWIKKMKKLIEQNDVEEWLDDDPEKKKWFREYKKNLQVEPFGVQDLPFTIRRDLILYSKDDFQKAEGYLIVLYSALNLFDAQVALELKKYLDRATIDGKPAVSSGESIVFGLLYRIIKVEGLVAIIASLLIVAFVVFIDLRHIGWTLLSIWPLLTGLLGMTILLAVFQIHLNLFNFVVLPALLGICVDAGVHMIHHYRSHPELGTYGVQRQLFGPISLASFTTVISFATTITAKHLGMQSIGVLAIVGLLSGLFSALYLLPAMMELVFRRFPLQQSAKEQE